MQKRNVIESVKNNFLKYKAIVRNKSIDLRAAREKVRSIIAEKYKGKK